MFIAVVQTEKINRGFITDTEEELLKQVTELISDIVNNSVAYENRYGVSKKSKILVHIGNTSKSFEVKEIPKFTLELIKEDNK